MAFSLEHDTPYWQAGVGLDRTAKGFLPADGFIAGDLLGTRGRSAFLSYSRAYAGGPLRRANGSICLVERDTLTELLQLRQ